MSARAVTWAYAQRAGGSGGGRKAVLVALADLADERHSCEPTVPVLAQMTELSPRAIGMHLAALVRAGLVAREQQRDAHGARRSDRFVLPVSVVVSVRQGADSADRQGAEVDTAPKKRAPRQGAKSAGSAMRDDDPRFVEFWSRYPRRVGKREALKAYAAALGRGATPEQILAGVDRYVAELRRRGTAPEYIKHPGPWLNAGRQDDEPTRALAPARAPIGQRTGTDF